MNLKMLTKLVDKYYKTGDEKIKDKILKYIELHCFIGLECLSEEKLMRIYNDLQKEDKKDGN